MPTTAVSDLVPRRSTLDGFAREVAVTAEGLNIRVADPLVPILVESVRSGGVTQT